MLSARAKSDYGGERVMVNPLTIIAARDPYYQHESQATSAANGLNMLNYAVVVAVILVAILQ